MGLCVVRHEIAASLGYRTAEDLQKELDDGEPLENDKQFLKKESCDSIPTNNNEASPTRGMAIEWFNTANDVLANTQSAVDVLSDLLNYDKVQSNTLTLELTKVPIWCLIQRTMDEFRLPAMNKQIEMKVNYEWGEQVYDNSDQLPSGLLSQLVVGDQIRLQQVLRNLASNAVKFTPENGRITVRARSVGMVSRIRRETVFELKDGEQITLHRSGSLEVVVEDSGVGLSPEQLAKLFSEHMQFNAGQLQGGKGSGLGLFISKGIVQQHDGALTASSKAW